LKIAEEDVDPDIKIGEAEIPKEENDEEINFATEYNYLMQLPIWSLTYEKVLEL